MAGYRQIFAIIGLTGLGLIAVISWTMFPDIAYMIYGETDDPDTELFSVAKASQGALIGISVPEGAIFRGIPFSQPPIGEFRFKDPRDSISFQGGVWNATYSRSACVQHCNNQVSEYSCPLAEETGEDCLYLNVWVPQRALELVKGDEIVSGEHYKISDKFLHEDNSSFAVMIFYHGGNFLTGAGSATLYDSRYLAHRGDVVAVTANYRVGPLGFLVHGSGEDSSHGNFGIRDQIKALEWVQRNIKYFGGHSKKVTIFGQSAGAESIGVLMTSPYGKGLFQQAIMESNPLGLPFRDVPNAIKFGNKFVQATGCDINDFVCLRNISTDNILDSFEKTQNDIIGIKKLMYMFQPWGPVIDGDFLPKQPVDAFIANEVEEIPMIIGSTADEGTLFISGAFGGSVMTDIEYYAMALAIFKLEQFAILLPKFPPQCGSHPSDTCDNRIALSNLTTQYVFICPQRIAMQKMNYPNTWFYFFNQTWSFFDLWENVMCYDKVCHATELVYVFDIANLTVIDFNPHERLLSQRVLTYWTNFAKYGNPNGDTSALEPSDRTPLRGNGLENNLYWPPFKQDSSQSYQLLQFIGTGDYVMDSPFNEACNFWDKLDAYAKHVE